MIDTVHQGGHVTSSQGLGKIPKGCGSSIQWDRGCWFKRKSRLLMSQGGDFDISGSESSKDLESL
jgi:hypothetical protein